MGIANKLGRKLAYNEELPLKKLHDPSITWACGITQQIKCVTFPLAEDLWTPN